MKSSLIRQTLFVLSECKGWISATGHETGQSLMLPQIEALRERLAEELSDVRAVRAEAGPGEDERGSYARGLREALEAIVREYHDPQGTSETRMVNIARRALATGPIFTEEDS